MVRIDPGSGRSTLAGHLDEPLSDLGAAVVGRRAYLVGGYTGTRFASAVLRYLGGGRTSTVARLPSGLFELPAGSRPPGTTKLAANY